MVLGSGRLHQMAFHRICPRIDGSESCRGSASTPRQCVHAKDQRRFCSFTILTVVESDRRCFSQESSVPSVKMTLSFRGTAISGVFAAQADLLCLLR
jgi:hypothetical protein